MSNSSLVNYTRKSPNHSGKRTHKIDRITPHCVVGQCSVETLGSIFAKTSKQASCNYAIGYDGKVALIVDEANRSWCSSSPANDQRGVTIECASDAYAPYKFNTKVYNKLVDLCVDICKRNKKKKLIWIADSKKALAYTPKSDEMLLTVHRWFKNKSCPGDWMYARMGTLASTVTKKLGGGFEDYKFKITEQCYVRAKPNKFAKAVLVVKKGEVYTCVGKSGKWLKLKSGCGYIHKSNTKKV